MVNLLTLVPDYGKFDIRTCPIWAIPQLAELKRRLSYSGARTAMILSFEVVRSYGVGSQMGRFVIDIPDEDIYYGYLSSMDMNDYRHPSLSVMY